MKGAGHLLPQNVTRAKLSTGFDYYTYDIKKMASTDRVLLESQALFWVLSVYLLI